MTHMRFHAEHERLSAAFGSDGFGSRAERLVRLFGTPTFLLTETRQAHCDKAVTEADARHREDLARTNLELLKRNTDLTEQVAQLARRIDGLTREIHGRVLGT